MPRPFHARQRCKVFSRSPLTSGDGCPEASFDASTFSAGNFAADSPAPSVCKSCQSNSSASELSVTTTNGPVAARDAASASQARAASSTSCTRPAPPGAKTSFKYARSAGSGDGMDSVAESSIVIPSKNHNHGWIWMNTDGFPRME